MAMPSGRVRFVANGQTFGLPVDHNGRFSASLPMPNKVLVLDMAYEDRGRLIKEDGYVLIIDQKQPFVLNLKPGQSARLSDPKARPLMIIERSGASVLSVKVQYRPSTKMSLSLNGQSYERTSDSQGSANWLIQGQFDAGLDIGLSRNDGISVKTVNLGPWVSSLMSGGSELDISQGSEWIRFSWPLPDGGKQESMITELS